MEICVHLPDLLSGEQPQTYLRREAPRYDVKMLKDARRFISCYLRLLSLMEIPQ